MWKKIIAISLAVAVLATVILVFKPFVPYTKVQAEEYRSGYRLVPKENDITGIGINSSFTLFCKESTSLAFIENNLELVGVNNLIIKKIHNKKFSITPPSPLPKNKLITFKLTSKSGQIVSWTFQTQMELSVLGTLPGNMSTNIPINSGIEIYFTHSGTENIEKYFEISPKTKGRFEFHGRTIVFVPTSLKEGTLYTVTIKKGLPIKNSTQFLKKDYTFSFETASNKKTNNNEVAGSFYFNQQLSEASTQEEILLPFNFYLNKNTYKNITINTSVYSFKDIDAFLDAIQKKESVPRWANYSFNKNKIKVETLEKVLEFSQDFSVYDRQNRYIKLPQALPVGYYLVEGVWKNIRFQTFLQVTNIAMYLSSSNSKTLIWLNNIKDGSPIKNANIELIKSNKSLKFKTDNKGIAFFDTPQPVNSPSRITYNFYFKITSNLEAAILPYYNHKNNRFDMNSYWHYFQTERSLYKPDDTVYFWGYVKARNENKELDQLTLEINRGNYFALPETKYPSIYLPYLSKPLITQSVLVDHSFYDGSIKLPNLEPGSYTINIKYKDNTINSYYINIQNYTKPAYKIEVTSDKKAIFVGEPIKFTVKSSFFEGTPVSSLDVNWSISGLNKQLRNTQKTDKEGKLTISYTPEISGDMQGERTLYFNAGAALPESGQIQGNSKVKVFINDINASFSSEAKNSTVTLTAKLNNIVLDKINSGKNKTYNDFLGSPVSGKTLSGTIIKHTWIKIEDGNFYDFINKVVQKKYRYEEKIEKLIGFKMETDANGIAEYSFELPDNTNSYYTAEIKTTDNKGRKMNFNIHIASTKKVFYTPGSSTRYQLTGVKDKYDLNDDVKLTFSKGSTPLPEGKNKFLFITAQNGLKKAYISDSPIYFNNFSRNMVPNIYVFGVYFNGRTYIQSNYANIAYNYNEKKLNLTVKTDKDKYKPGDECTVYVKATDKNAIPVAANVCLAVVDEALFKLNEQNISVLQNLYTQLPSGVNQTYISHRANNYSLSYGYSGNVRTYMSKGIMESVKAEADTSIAIKITNNYIRQNFKDTAYFSTLTLNSNGYGEFHFNLPDNITSWRISLAGISHNIHGGVGKAELKVSMPFFINAVMNTTYLVGDKPYIGISSYGENLSKGETIYYEITSPSKPDFKQTAQGKAFERVYIPLWELKEGNYDITITARSVSGLADSLQKSIQVIPTYHEIEKAVYNTLKPKMKIPVGSKGLTTLLFIDQGRGKLMPSLYSLAYSSGNRLDQKYIAVLASNMIKSYFSKDVLWKESVNINLSEYQNPDGGFGILPYSESDPDFTALITPLIVDKIDKNRLINYFYSVLLKQPNRPLPSALFGLALLEEPVLIELNKASEIKNLEFKDSIFISLAYAALGETPSANKIYSERVLPFIESKAPYAQVVKGKNKDEILKNTALAAVLASKLGRTEAENLFSYITNNYSKEILVNIEKLLYIKQTISSLTPENAEISYSYDGKNYTEKLKGGYPKSITIPSQKISGFIINSVKGKACIVSIFKTSSSYQGKNDNNLKLLRSYYKYNSNTKTNSFNQNDIIKVVLNWDISENALDSSYVITDYCPSGLKPISSPHQMGIKSENVYWYFRNIDGQKVTFHIYKSKQNPKPLIYYARVINIGSFKADSPIIQGSFVHDSILVGKPERIMID